MAVFSRIVDVEMFSEVVLSAVREEEKRELQHRLGLLNVLNPVRVRLANVFPPHAACAKTTRGALLLPKVFDIYIYTDGRVDRNKTEIV